MIKEICFDLDGTLANLYGVEGWLDSLRSFDPTPYIIAKPLLNMSALARLIHKVQKLGYTVKVISWLPKDTSTEYDFLVTVAKVEWLRKHLPSVKFDDIIIVEYGVPKSTLGCGVLFDDNADIRAEWAGTAYEPSEILNFLRKVVEI